MKQMTHGLRKKIRLMVKNKHDISDIIENVNIKGEDLSHAIISRFNRTGQDMSRTNFSHATIGQEGVVTNLSGNKLRDCDFCHAHFLRV